MEWKQRWLKSTAFLVVEELQIMAIYTDWLVTNTQR